MESDFICENESSDCFIITDRDSDIILRQMKGRKFNRDLLLGVASRCVGGKPQVLLCKSLHNGMPFPNNFWLSCPVLVKIAGREESNGGVKKLELYISENSNDNWVEYNRLHAWIRIKLTNKTDLELLKKNNLTLYNEFCDNMIGIGGIKSINEVKVKCLHLQIASFLSLGYHPGQDWLKEKISSFHFNNQLKSILKTSKGQEHGNKRSFRITDYANETIG